MVFSPLGQAFISAYGWETALVFLASSALLIAPLAFVLPGSAAVRGEAPVPDQSLPAALREAFGHRGYTLLTTGFFVCGFHVAFITVHFPAYVRDIGALRRGGGGGDSGHRPVQHPRARSRPAPPASAGARSAG